MLIFGFSLNMLTLLGLILAIGIVVDDAIVVVENVDRIMNTEGLPPQQATRKAMSGLSGALIAMSLALLRRIRPRKLPSGHHGTALPPVHHHHRRISRHIHRCGAVPVARYVRQAPAPRLRQQKATHIPPHQPVAQPWQQNIRKGHSRGALKAKTYVCGIRDSSSCSSGS